MVAGRRAEPRAGQRCRAMSLPSGGPLYGWWQAQALITLPFAMMEIKLPWPPPSRFARRVPAADS